MKIRNLKIKSFRGIKDLNWNVPSANIICLIGKGDSSKSTVLDAIRFVFYPHWNLNLSDTDFYKCNVDSPLSIEVTIGELINEFYSLSKYGSHLRGWDSNTLSIIDEPDDNVENALTIRLIVEKDLEPKWQVISERQKDNVEFKLADRIKVGVGLIGEYSEKQLSWAKGTALANLTEIQNLTESFINAARQARSSFDINREVHLKNFDAAAKISEKVARQLGVPVDDHYNAHLDLNSINIKMSGLSLHDGDVPLRLLGSGSKRMLLCGIQKMILEKGHITLFDEVELGLEPHRITRLLKYIRGDLTGQYFLTTHSPAVLRELSINDLHIIHNNSGMIEVVAASTQQLDELNIQGKIRSSAEAFLSKKVIICEGATEVGFIRGFDDLQVHNGKDPLSYYGVALIDVNGGSKVMQMAKAFHALHYNVAVLADGDAPDQFTPSQIAELESLGIHITIWSENFSLEERVISDLPWALVLKSIELAINQNGTFVVQQILENTNNSLETNFEIWAESLSLRNIIGVTAKKRGWFKDITKGSLWLKEIADAFSDPDFLNKNTAININRLWSWIENDECSCP